MPAVKRERRGLGRFLILLTLIGPGIITSSADNDAGGIATYTLAGAQEGYSLLWALFLTTLALVVIQEMSARMGVVTGKGLADLIREKFSMRTTFFTMLLLVVGNLTVTIAEFAGIAAGFELLGVSRLLSVPLMALIIWLIVIKGSYIAVERVMLFFCLIYFTYVVSGFMAQPDWNEVVAGLVHPTFKFETGYINLFIALVGTTITPWMQFYLQASVVDKGLKKENYKFLKWDVYIGSFITDFVAMFIIIAAAATLYANGNREVNDAFQAALALKPLAGNYAFILFSIGLLNASVLGAIILPLSTSYAVSEAFGWESGLGKKFHSAPKFFWFYTVILAIGAGFILIPNLKLIMVMLISQTVNGILLPIILILMLKLINDKSIMGENVNTLGQNILSIITASILIVLTFLLLLGIFYPPSMDYLASLFQGR
ncbi:MAG: divalent metal cation transporter [Candidatus Schekmanbacteria bacterium]|nr:MAG: divalent metal cation transporter [Candidatus Schekmanbacteria bacterium]